MKGIENKKLICEAKGEYMSCPSCVHGIKHKFTGEYACFRSSNSAGHTRGGGNVKCIYSRCVLIEEKNEEVRE